MRVPISLLQRTALLTALCSCAVTATPTPAKPSAPKPAPTRPAAKPPAGANTTAAVDDSSTEPPAAEVPPTSVRLHCFQCTGESTDPDDHCTDSGWVSIPHGQRLDYRYLCPGGIDDFCMKTIERWESTRRGVADKYRTRRGCSSKTRTSQQSGDTLGAGVKFIVSNGCTDSRKNPATGAYVQMCFCDMPLCNTGGWRSAPSAQLLLQLLLAAVWR